MGTTLLQTQWLPLHYGRRPGSLFHCQLSYFHVLTHPRLFLHQRKQQNLRHCSNPHRWKQLWGKSFPTSCTSHTEFFTFPLVDVASCVQIWVCSQHDHGSLGQRDTSDRRPQWSCLNMPFLGNLVPHKLSLSQPQDYFLCCLHLPALPLPVVSAAVTSFSLSCVAPVQATFNCYFFHLPLKNSTYIIFPCR